MNRQLATLFAIVVCSTHYVIQASAPNIISDMEDIALAVEQQPTPTPDEINTQLHIDYPGLSDHAYQVITEIAPEFPIAFARRLHCYPGRVLYDLPADVSGAIQAANERVNDFCLKAIMLDDEKLALAAVKILVARGADVHYQSSLTYAPLHASSYARGFTPLTLATAQSKLSVVQFLLDNGANVLQLNAFGDTALRVARVWRGPAHPITQLLQEHSASIAPLAAAASSMTLDDE